MIRRPELLAALLSTAVCSLPPSLAFISSPPAEAGPAIASLPASRRADDATSAATRSDFLSAGASVGLSAAAAAAAALAASPPPALARGRATLEQSYDRYAPRIVAGGKFYSTELRAAVERGDFSAIKSATSDPPPKSKEDRAKVDGGVSERAAKAGGFSDARVLAACDLFAASFSDNSVSPKTKAMKAEVEGLREVVQGMNTAAKQALGEEKASGGLFGLGAKQPTKTELLQTVRELYVKGGNYYNRYVYAANDELPIQLKKFPYL